MAVRLPQPHEPGVEFGDLLSEQLGRSGSARVITFLLSWDLLESELKRPPTPDELAGRFGWDRSTAYRDLELLRSATGEDDPSRIAEMLWEGIGGGTGIGSLLSVRVTDTSDEREQALRSLADWEPDLEIDELDRLRRVRTFP